MSYSERIAGWCARHPLWVIAFFLGASLVSIWGGTRHLGVEMDPVALLDPTLEWRANALDLRARFPHREDTIVAHVTGATPEAADQARIAFFEAMAARERWSVDSAGHADFFARHGLLFRDLDALQELTDRLARAQPLIGSVVNDPSLVGFFQILRRVAEADAQQLPAWQPLLAQVTEVLQRIDEDGAPALSWQSLMLTEGEVATRPLLVVARPPAGMDKREALAQARQTLAEVRARAPQATIQLTGSIPLWIEEIDSALQGASVAGVIALFAVALLLGLGLRAWQLVLASMLTLIAGLAITLGFATLAVGRLNLISVGFAALFIGLAIDFAVHVGARFREERARLPESPTEVALGRALRGVGGALGLCAVSAAAAFFSFAPTSYDGVAELGIIGGAGMLIGWFGALTLLPACIALLPAVSPPQLSSTAVPERIARIAMLGVTHRGAVRWTVVALAVVAALLASQARFNYNPMHLKPKDSVALQTFESLLHTGPSPLHAQLLLTDDDQAAELAGRLTALPEVSRVVWLERFVPVQQEAKLAVLDDMQWSIGFSLPEERLQIMERPVAQVRTAMEDTTEALALRALPSTQLLAEAMQRWLERPRSEADWARLRLRLLGHLPAVLERLRQQLQAEPVHRSGLPPSLRTQWLDGEGHYRLQIEPAVHLFDNAALLAFVDAVSEVAPRATGAPMEYVYSSRTIIHAFVTAFALALAVITVLLLTLLGSAADTARALAPLLLGALLLVAAMVLTRLSFNFANVIVLPLLLGISVANGIHIIWRGRADGSVNPVASSAGRAVLVSVATTLASFIALWLSPHRGMSSIGALLGMGLVLQLLCTFVVLPALMRHGEGDRRPTS
ncbi:MMPL family transporter [Algiphilus sp.]|uniref:MMPL family transporter n=1 Tax=Algiphilus sp. TaxID=1872431 RepID=UPI003BA93872